MNSAKTSFAVLFALAAAALGACSSDPTDPVVEPPPLERIWRATTTTFESTIELETGGAAAVVDAAFDARTCAEFGGSWTSDATRLELSLTGDAGPEQRSYTYEVFSDRLELTAAGETTTYRPATTLPTCSSYDFRSWTGTLTAEVDGLAQSFANISVIPALSAGLLEVRACPTAGPSCEVGDAELILKIDAPPGPLTAGTYPIQNNAIGQPNFFALIDPFPADTTFPGFNTERLEPPGVFDLTSVSDTRVTGAFEFRANEISEGLSAPDGRRFVLVTNGVVELEYR
jgi:hypothetical protein